MSSEPDNHSPQAADRKFLHLVNFPSRAALLQDVEKCLKDNQGFSIATLNLDHITKLRREDAFRRAYEKHSHVVADGNPIVWLRAVMKQPVELVPGSELILPLIQLAHRLEMPVALLGSTDETLAIAAEKLKAAFPGLEVVAQISPPFGFDPTGAAADDALASVAESGARLCLLALGAPKQEILASRGVDQVPGCGFVSIGAGIDFIAGTQRRAPRWVRRIAMEWFWRMATNPMRLARRYGECFVILPGLFLSAWGAKRSK